MAMYDWNGNGKNDMVDNFIEYKLSGCDSEDNQENYHYSNNRSSGSGLKVIVIGFFAMVYLFFIFGTDVSEIPGLFLFVVWGLVTLVVKLILDNM